MTVTLTPRAEALLRELAHLGTPEEIVEMALEALARQHQETLHSRMTPAEAVEHIRRVRVGNTLGDLSIKELVNEGRKY